MRFELKRLQRELSLTTVYVTHDQSEALALSHQIAVMNEGRIVQIGTPREIYERPREPVRRRFRRHHQFHRRHCDGARRRPGRCIVSSAIGELKAHAGEGVAKNGAVIVSVRPEDIELFGSAARQRPRATTSCWGTVAAKDFLGDYLDFQRQGRRCCAAGAGASVAAHADRRPDLSAHEGGQMRRLFQERNRRRNQCAKKVWAVAWRLV